MSENKNKEESTIELAKRVGSKEAARLITEQKAKQKQEKGFEKTGQYYFDLGLKQGGLAKWFNENWVDISAPKKGGGYKECGRKSANGSKRGYPKCVPAAKAARMSESQKRSAVIRKRSVGNVGPKPTNVKTIVNKPKKMQTGGIYNMTKMRYI
jgi:hypothetical protein